MGCKTVHFDGGSAIVCSRGQRPKPCTVVFCGRPSVALCDYPVERNGKKTTCDSPMCATHRHPVPDQTDTDWCDGHWAHEQRNLK